MTSLRHLPGCPARRIERYRSADGIDTVRCIDCANAVFAQGLDAMRPTAVAEREAGYDPSLDAPATIRERIRWFFDDRPELRFWRRRRRREAPEPKVVTLEERTAIRRLASARRRAALAPPDPRGKIRAGRVSP